MKKKLVLTIICLMLVSLIAITMVGCKESYKQKAVQVDWNNIAVTSNNGLSVKVGNYLYFVNGYADKTGDNTFGSTVKGAIMRVELVDNIPKRDSLVTIVPKNIYNSNAALGIVVKGEYIYYSTPSVKKDSNGKPKTDKMDLMRTKLDGTGTQLIASFDDFATVYQVTDKHILYVRESKLFEIDLASKKFKTKEIVDKINGYKFYGYDKANSYFANAVIFEKNMEGETVYHNQIFAYVAGSGEAKVIMDGLKSYESASLPHVKGYRATLVSLDLIDKDTLRVYYNKTDSTPNSISKGNYSYDFKKNFEFDSKNEVRYTLGKQYTSFYRLNSNYIMALDGSSYDLGSYSTETKTWTFTPLISVASITVLQNTATGTEVFVTYVADNKIRKIKVLNKVAEDYIPSITEVTTLYSGPYFSTWLTYDIVNNVVYFFNSDVKNYTYFLDLSSVVRFKDNTMKPTRLGAFSKADLIDMLEEPPKETSENK